MAPESCVGVFPLGQKSSLKVKVSLSGISMPYSSPLSPPLTATFSPSTSSTSFSIWLDELRVPGWYLWRRGKRVRVSKNNDELENQLEILAAYK